MAFLLQSGSSFILANFEELIATHSVIVAFLTMLVGAGGNAGNQVSMFHPHPMFHGPHPMFHGPHPMFHGPHPMFHGPRRRGLSGLADDYTA